MNRPNIISAGRMMAIVVMLLGAFHCGATFVQMHEGLIWNVLFGAAIVVCGLALMVMFGRVERHFALGTPILVVGTLVALLGVVAVALVYRNPFSWMMAIVGLAIFIDALCLKISLSSSHD